MAEIIIMPKLGLTMTEGIVSKWLVKEGDKIAKGDVIFEISTDKIANEIESNTSGILLKILVDEGENALVKQPVGIIGEAGEDVTDLLKSSNKEEEKVKEKIEEAVIEEEKRSLKEDGYVLASPLAKKVASDNNINLNNIRGTGPNGRVVEKDVINYIQISSLKNKATPMAERISKELDVSLGDINKTGRIMKEDVIRFAKSRDELLAADPEDRKIPMSSMRKIIGRRMLDSWTTSPAVNYNLRVDMTNIKGFKKQISIERKVSYTDILVKICAKALLEHPYINSTLDNDEIIIRNYVNIGVAVAIDDGLIVPVVKFADKKGISEISRDVRDLAARARNDELRPDEISGGTFTITNLGMFGMESFSPIINQPETAILGVNTILDTPVVEDGEIVIKPLMNLSLTADHRVIDGAAAAQFMARLKELIENPSLLTL